MTKGIKFTVSYDDFDAAVLHEMQNTIRDILADPWSGHHNYKDSLKDVDSFLRVVDWYSRKEEYDAFLDETMEAYADLVDKASPSVGSGDLSIEITDLKDMPDGSAYMEYEASPKMKEFLMGVGLQKIILDACVEALAEQEEAPSVKVNYTGWEYYGEET